MSISHVWVPAETVGAAVGMKAGTILCWWRKGRIPGRKLGPKTVRFNLADVLAALRETAPNESTVGRENVR
jgi:hypothetical protein